MRQFTFCIPPRFERAHLSQLICAITMSDVYLVWTVFPSVTYSHYHCARHRRIVYSSRWVWQRGLTSKWIWYDLDNTIYWFYVCCNSILPLHNCILSYVFLFHFVKILHFLCRVCFFSCKIQTRKSGFDAYLSLEFSRIAFSHTYLHFRWAVL